MVTKQGSVAWNDTHTPRYWVAGGVQLQCVCGVAEGLTVDMSEERGAQGSSPPAQCTGPGPGSRGGPSCPSSSPLGWGVLPQETVSETGEGKEAAPSTRRREHGQASWYWHCLQSICQFALSLPGYF